MRHEGQQIIFTEKPGQNQLVRRIQLAQPSCSGTGRAKPATVSMTAKVKPP